MPAETPYAIRPCVPDDAETLVALVRALAAFEKLESEVIATPADFRRFLFGPEAHAEALLAEEGETPVGFALFFPTFSTFRARPGLYLEDLYVVPERRGRGIGKALLAALAGIAVARGYWRLEWAVLHWNEPAIGFYKSLGARPNDEWSVYRLADEPLRRLAERAGEPTGNRPG